MYEVAFSKKSRKQLKRLRKSGVFDLETLDVVLKTLSRGEKLDHKYQDHWLQGNLSGCQECHLSRGILLMYKVYESLKTVAVLEIGTHSELFGH